MGDRTHVTQRLVQLFFPCAFLLVTCFWFVRLCFSNSLIHLFIPSWQSFQAFHLMLLIGSFRSMLVSRTCLWLCTPSNYSESLLVSAFHRSPLWSCTIVCKILLFLGKFREWVFEFAFGWRCFCIFVKIFYCNPPRATLLKRQKYSIAW